ncbi:Protein-glutamate O-methyltransferase [Halovivax asiaticus JCM 14624]|uniref:protein-glutamate O-methyltransferase n=1 Tax=Halovivax asiaticus JCM 14624 TaxID=1227490 RepID=M0BT94_9EURY|nr:protein-glutamate O-methyltransferase CheR [Halovivax asiaticus]ELZ13603.1 Protein-glutamate O-methyltransferase [Halovivax asiaticus JCM 14624]
MTDVGFESICSFVEDELEFATSHYNDSYLDRRISSRIRRTGSDGYDDYHELLAADSDEQEAILDSLSINVTGFFRNPDVWEGIREVLVTLSQSPGSIHVWSAACADGRETYSISMLAHEDPRIDASDLFVLGTDISPPALETARAGVYEQSRTTDIEGQLDFLESPEEYVTQRDGAFHVTETPRENVTFQRHDLINDQPKAGFDLVICRNLFIYIDPSYKAPILKTLGRSLQSDGYLVIGKAETIPPELKSLFAVHDGRLRIYTLAADDSV